MLAVRQNRAGELRIIGAALPPRRFHLARMREEGLIDSQRDAQRIHSFH